MRNLRTLATCGRRITLRNLRNFSDTRDWRPTSDAAVTLDAARRASSAGSPSAGADSGPPRQTSRFARGSGCPLGPTPTGWAISPAPHATRMVRVRCFPVRPSNDHPVQQRRQHHVQRVCRHQTQQRGHHHGGHEPQSRPNAPGRAAGGPPFTGVSPRPGLAAGSPRRGPAPAAPRPSRTSRTSGRPCGRPGP